MRTYGEVVAEVPDYPRVGGASAADVWSYTTRGLTDKAGFMISGTKTTLDALHDVAAADIWAVSVRSLTDKAGFTISGTKTTLDVLHDVAAADIWAVATRTLSGFTGTPRSDLLGEDASFEAGTGARKAKIDALLAAVTEVEGTLTATATEQNLISTADNKAHHVEGQIDLSNMASGDTVEIKQYMKVKSGGAFILYADEVYSGAQTIPMLNVLSKAGKYGIQVTLKQTAGSPYKTFDYLFEKVMRT